MIDHVSIPARNLTESADAYERVLGPLGLTRLVERERTVGFGKRYPEFWLNHRPALWPIPQDSGHHVSLRAPDDAAVRAFHAAALSIGWKDAGAPSPRPAAMRTVYSSFVLDPDGNKIEAITFPRE